MANLQATTEAVMERRPAAESDAEFLFALYAATRRDELSGLGWGSDQEDSFLNMQFGARREHYRRECPEACDEIVLLEGRPVGRMLTDRSDEAVTLVDIALLPSHRGRGIGTSLVESLMAEAGRTGKSVQLHVERSSPALRFYQRLGFVTIGERGPHVQMEWRV